MILGRIGYLDHNQIKKISDPNEDLMEDPKGHGGERFEV